MRLRALRHHILDCILQKNLGQSRKYLRSYKMIFREQN